MYGTSNMETYITIYKIIGQQEFSVWISKLKQGLWIKLKGWDGEEDGSELQKGGDICIPVADSWFMLGFDSCWGLTENQIKFWKSIILPFKIIKLKKKKKEPESAIFADPGEPSGSQEANGNLPRAYILAVTILGNSFYQKDSGFSKHYFEFFLSCY